jgi:hypothetical protein
MKTSVRNVAPGIRGLNTVQGYRDLAPGEFVESVELTDDEHKSADSTGYFAFGKAAKTAETAAPAGAAAPAPAEELPNNVPTTSITWPTTICATRSRPSRASRRRITPTPTATSF